MSFLYPLGLLGLIAVPILIIIYLIKNKYTEQVIASTYLWTLSERFLKRKKPIKRITGLISLLLQILAVIAVSLAIAHPVFTLPGQAMDYLFILDGSGSMYIEREGKTRFELGKEEIASVIRGSAKGSSYSLVCVGDTTDKVFEDVTDSKRALSMLEGVEGSYTSSALTNALRLAQEAFAKNNALQIYFVTDKGYESVENVRLVNLDGGEKNCALGEVTAQTAGSTLTVTGELYAYNGSASIQLSLYVDERTEPVETKDLSVPQFDGENAFAFTFTCGEVEYDSLKVKIETGDALALDNETVVYNDKSDDTYTTLIVSDSSTFFLQSVLRSLGNLKTYVWSTEKYETWQADPSSVTDETHGTIPADFGLYIYNGYTPDALPKHSAVWFINPTETLSYTGFGVSDREDFGNPPKEEVAWNDELNVGRLEFSTSTATSVTELLQYVNIGEDLLSVSYYTSCNLIRDFRELLYCNNDPVVFAGANDFGNRQVVFAFDLLDVNMSTEFSFPVLVYNLMNYTFPQIVDGTSYACGDTVRINVLSNVASIRVETPSGKILYLDTSSDVAEFEMTEVGVHTVVLTSGASQSTLRLYGNLPKAESVPSGTEERFALSGTPSSANRDGIYDDLWLLFMILAVVFVADWMVYCYEQYQLR